MTGRIVTLVCVALIVILAFLSLSTLVMAEVPVRPNPYLVESFIDDEGRQIDLIIVPGRPPEERISEAFASDIDIIQADATLSNVPAFTWCYGCSATSAAMMFGYYDRTGYPKMYTGPTNGGVMPLDNSVWPDWFDGVNWRQQCPLSATHNGLDGRDTNGHVDDYWIYFGQPGPDPWVGSWTEHTHADCTADFMGTNQWMPGPPSGYNVDGSTVFAFSPSPVYDYQGYEPGLRLGTHGMRLFVESRGYNVYHDGTNYQNYNQYIDTYATGGFTFEQYKAEIDAGRPVLIQVKGHTMLGYGYNDPDTVYIYNTWDYSDHWMTWGGYYSNMQHYAVTVVQLKALPEITSCNDTGMGKTFFQPDDNISVEGSQFDPSTSYKIWIQDSPVSEGDSLVSEEDESGLKELVSTDGSGNLGRTDIWALSSEPFAHHDYDIVVDRQDDGGNTDKYNVASDGEVSIHVGMGGDVNGNQLIDMVDAIAVRNHWGFGTPISNLWAGDVNCDGEINMIDALAIRNSWAFGTPLNCCSQEGT
jgi:hypothetical protein